MGSRDRSVGSSQCNPERLVPKAQHCNRSAERRRRGMFPSMSEELAVVETPSVRFFQRVRGRETRPCL